LCDGLRFVGYDKISLKQRVMFKGNVEKFKSFHGVAPSTLMLFVKDLKGASRHFLQTRDDDLHLLER